MSRAVQSQQRQQNETEEKKQDFAEDIDKLTELAISASDIKKMKDAGYFTVSSVLMHTKKALCEVKGLSEPKIDKIRDAALKLVGAGFITGTEAREKRSRVYHVSTGSQALDEIIGGGIETGSITEAFGEFRCGKTQLSHTLCVTAQLPVDMGGGNGRVAFIDTENTFRPERVVSICNRFDLNSDDVLDNILVARAYTSEHQCELLDHVAARMAADRFALLIVDSATALFRVDFTGRGELASRQQKLNQFLSRLSKLSEQFNVAVWITNQVMSTPDAMAFAADKKPIGGKLSRILIIPHNGTWIEILTNICELHFCECSIEGHVMAHASTTRLALRKGRGDQRIAKIFDSPMYAETEATFVINNGGVCDVSD